MNVVRPIPIQNRYYVSELELVLKWLEVSSYISGDIQNISYMTSIYNLSLKTSFTYGICFLSFDTHEMWPIEVFKNIRISLR